MPGEPNGSFQAFRSFLDRVGCRRSDGVGGVGNDNAPVTGTAQVAAKPLSHLFTVLYGLRGVLWRLRAAKALAESAMFALMESEGAATFIGRHGLQDHCTCYENELFALRC